MSNIDKRAQKELYAQVEKQAHKLRGNPIAYQVVTGMCPVNVIEMHAKKIQALLDELEAEQRISSTWRKTAESNREKLETAGARIAELESREAKTVWPDIDMSDPDCFTITRLHEIIYASELKWPEPKLLARFILDVKQHAGIAKGE